MQLIGVDVGGTFTDLVFADTDSGRTEIHKVATTPEDPSRGIRDGVRALCERFSIPAGGVEHLFHGTTIATNAVLQHDGARTGMVTTRNYRDILHIGRHQRPQHYSIRQEIPWQDRPLVRRRHRIGVTERLAPPRGEVLVALDEDEVRAAARTLRDAGVEAVTVCFLFSYLNPEHEERARDILQEELPGCFITCSSAVSPQFREFERFTTAAMNAFVGPKVRRYVERLASEIAAEGLRADLHIMSSNGGVATAKMVAERPVMTLLSGPAAGVLGGAWTGEIAERDRLITFDMGGTSADIGIVTDGRFSEASARDTWIAGYPLLASMIDIHSIGAGGGSIAHVDPGGGFRVGPRSAGAEPGPAAYGRGGTEPTVTDANVVLGRLHKDYFLGGAMPLDETAATRALGTLSETLELSPTEAAEGVLTIVTSNMANAIRSRTVQKGIDPREYALVAFGGAGPLHAVDVAAELGAAEVIVPRYPGITSAMGLLTTDLKYDTIRTEFQVSGEVDLARLNADLAAMEAELTNQFRADGIDAADVRFMRGGDLRYVGQGYELRVDFPPGEVSATALSSILERFHAQHEAEYGHVFAESAIEIVNVRVSGVGSMPKIARPRPRPGGSLAAARVDTGQCLFRTASGLESFATHFYARDRLPAEERFAGPAIIVQQDSTTVVPPGAEAMAHARGHLVVQVGDRIGEHT